MIANPAGPAAIVPRIIRMIAAGMEHGITRIITEPAGVTVMKIGAAAIVRNLQSHPLR